MTGKVRKRKGTNTGTGKNEGRQWKIMKKQKVERK